MAETPKHVLFLCTENSARSIMAEAILNREGKGYFIAHSAGSHPTKQVNPLVIDLLRTDGYDTGFARAKSWDEFATPASPHMDFVITVCDNAAATECPVWPGHPGNAHWSIPDPALAEGNEAQRGLAFAEVYGMLSNRIVAFCALPHDTIDRMALHDQVREIGRMTDETRS